MKIFTATLITFSFQIEFEIYRISINLNWSSKCLRLIEQITLKDSISMIQQNRSALVLVPSFARPTFTHNSLSVRAVNFWNDLPTDIKESRSLPLFENGMKKLLIAKYINF